MENNTKHKDDCGRVFAKLDMTCPRCTELADGAKPRKGWGSKYDGRKHCNSCGGKCCLK